MLNLVHNYCRLHLDRYPQLIPRESHASIQATADNEEETDGKMEEIVLRGVTRLRF
jgi:hypothetical protein